MWRKVNKNIGQFLNIGSALLINNTTCYKAPKAVGNVTQMLEVYSKQSGQELQNKIFTI